MNSRRFTRFLTLAVLGCPLALVPVPASAQTIGIGPRLAFVRGSSSSPDTASANYIGGQIRLHASNRTAIEVSLDYRTTTDTVQSTKTTDRPIQASLLLYPVRSTLSIYLLGGAGWYYQKVEELNVAGSTVSATKMGYHAGLGGELAFGKHAAFHVDYRYTFIHLGSQESTSTSPGAIPIPGLGDIQQSLKLSHEGSMWTAGVTVYF